MTSLMKINNVYSLKIRIRIRMYLLLTLKCLKVNLMTLSVFRKFFARLKLSMLWNRVFLDFCKEN